MNQLRTGDIIAFSFMTFALFIGAGNIIFPPIVASRAGEHVWLAAFGFLITAVGLPVMTIMALSRMQGSIEVISSPRSFCKFITDHRLLFICRAIICNTTYRHRVLWNWFCAIFWHIQQ